MSAAKAVTESGKCAFCQLDFNAPDAGVVFEDEYSVAFLDHRPLFHGHVLLIPRTHFETFAGLPHETLLRIMQNAQLVSRAIQGAMHADGIFLAANNGVSQSVPHFHLHLVPRRNKDGLKGFFWPRTKYKDGEELARVRDAIRQALAGIKMDPASRPVQEWVLR